MNTHTETSECQLLGLTARTIETPEDVESLRQVRNATAWGFSHDTSQISPEQQRGWWATMRGKVRGWLYRLPAGDVVGFGVLRQTDDGRWWNSVGVLPAFAGRGYGGAITADLARRHAGPVWATARRDNPAAIRLHRAADWQQVDSGDPRLVGFVTRPHVYEANSSTD